MNREFNPRDTSKGKDDPTSVDKEKDPIKLIDYFFDSRDATKSDLNANDARNFTIYYSRDEN